MNHTPAVACLAEKVLEAVRAQPGQKAKEIAKKLGVDKTAVNSLLYGHLRGQVVKDDTFCWRPAGASEGPKRESRSVPQNGGRSPERMEAPNGGKGLRSDERFNQLLHWLGTEHHTWLTTLWNTYLLQEGPITASDGEILAEPLLWFQFDDRLVACFGAIEPGPHTRDKLEDNGIVVIRPGEVFGTWTLIAQCLFNSDRY